MYLQPLHLISLTLYPSTCPSPPCYGSFLPLSSFLLHHPLLLSLFYLLPPSTSSFLFLCPPFTPKHMTGDRAGPEIRSQALVGDRQAPEGAHRQAVPRALAQPPESRGEEDIVDRGGGPYHLPGARETGEPLGRNCQAATGQVRRHVVKRGMWKKKKLDESLNTCWLAVKCCGLRD